MNTKTDLTIELTDILRFHGADLVGIGDLTLLPSEQRCGLPFGISVAVKYPKEIIKGISMLPTPEYKQWYDRLNERLDQMVPQAQYFWKNMAIMLWQKAGRRSEAMTITA